MQDDFEQDDFEQDDFEQGGFERGAIPGPNPYTFTWWIEDDYKATKVSVHARSEEEARNLVTKALQTISDNIERFNALSKQFADSSEDKSEPGKRARIALLLAINDFWPSLGIEKIVEPEKHAIVLEVIKGKPKVTPFFGVTFNSYDY